MLYKELDREESLESLVKIRRLNAGFDR